jgi:plastocyanin
MILAAMPAMPAPEAPAATTAPATRSVDVTDAAVSPNALVVPPGARVAWTNVGRNRHTVTADDGRFDSGALIPGAGFTISAPADPGVYAYHCRFHAFIRGTLTVSLVSLDVPAPVRVGERATLRGTVPGAAAGTPVSLERRVPGAWEPVAATATAADGTFAAGSPPLSARTAFRAVAGGLLSPSVRAEVRPHVDVSRAGARLRVTVEPAGAGGRVVLSTLSLDTYRWRALARRPLLGGTATFLLRAPGVYRVTASPDRGLSEASSPPLQFRLVRFHR